MRRLIWLVLFAIAACAPRGEIAYVSEPAGIVDPIFVGSTRGADPKSGEEFGYERSESLRLARFDIGVPPDHKLGELSYATDQRAADPAHDFVVTHSQTYAKDTAFRADLGRAIAQQGGDVVIFIHGFNVNFAEGLYRLAQMHVDYELEGVQIYYSWPSRGHALGYEYDRDSALFARDGLQELLRQVRLAGAKRIRLVGHSMGSLITMETLRQIAMTKDETLSRITSVVLVSPDLDVELFRSQVRQIGKLPQPFLIFTSQKDKALRLSARISGVDSRLGNLENADRVADLKVTMIDVGAFSVGGGHFDVANSPELIKLLRNLEKMAKALEGEGQHQSLASGVILTVQNATQVILSPVGAAFDG